MSETDLRIDEAVTEDHEMDGEEEYNDGGYDEEEEELFDDENADEEAEAVAKRLGDALWADISKAYAQQGATQPGNASTLLAVLSEAQASSHQPLSPSLSEEGDDEDTLASAIQAVLDLSSNQPSLHQVLLDTIVPGTQEETLLDILTEVAGTKTVTPELADILSTLVQSVADGDLFASGI